MDQTHANGVRIACIGFGEVASALATGRRGTAPPAEPACDRKTTDTVPGIHDAKRVDHATFGAAGTGA